jgi:hypothetical protein
MESATKNLHQRKSTGVFTCPDCGNVVMGYQVLRGLSGSIGPGLLLDIPICTNHDDYSREMRWSGE